MATPIQPNREVALTARPNLDPFAAENLEILTTGWQGAFGYYDPNFRQISDVEQLLALVEEADHSGRELYVTYARPWLTRGEQGKLLELMKNQELFETVATFYGFEPRGVTHVCRYLGR